MKRIVVFVITRPSIHTYLWLRKACVHRLMYYSLNVFWHVGSLLKYFAECCSFSGVNLICSTFRNCVLFRHQMLMENRFYPLERSGLRHWIYSVFFLNCSTNWDLTFLFPMIESDPVSEKLCVPYTVWGRVVTEGFVWHEVWWHINNLIKIKLLLSHWSVSSLTFVAGDEILAVNGEALQGMSHAEAIAAFKRIRSGPVALRLARRHVLRYAPNITQLFCYLMLRVVHVGY
jgi:hypothetical protein